MNRTALLLALAAGAACSPSAPVATDDAGGPTDDLSAALGVDAAAALADLSSGGGAQDLSRVADLAMMAGYPAGPYGTTVGSTMANFHWEGYRDDLADAVATTKPYGAYSLDDLRRSGRTHAMVHLSEVFWPGCQNAARDLAAMGNTIVTAGGAIVEVLETKFVSANPSKSDLDAWINTYRIPVTSVRDPDASGLTTYRALGVRETCYLLDLSTMKIVQKINGSTAGVGDSSAKTCMQSLLGLLGPKGG